MLEDFAKAIEDCDTALKIDPKHTKVSIPLLDSPKVVLQKSDVAF
jgi:hypothetical protein